MKISEGIFHHVPDDLRMIIKSNSDLLEKWNHLTDIARNEWICWATIPKKEETRRKRIERLQTDIISGKKRPCCWPGCPHRNPNANKWYHK
ncbi:MAG: YdeI/OmpD-associated family protein [Chitinophagaceae bacterium]|nr:YdeI/OmpD-associated family protein [Chitinophagaceae bacterium]